MIFFWNLLKYYTFFHWPLLQIHIFFQLFSTSNFIDFVSLPLKFHLKFPLISSIGVHFIMENSFVINTKKASRKQSNVLFFHVRCGVIFHLTNGEAFWSFSRGFSNKKLFVVVRVLKSQQVHAFITKVSLKIMIFFIYHMSDQSKCRF